MPPTLIAFQGETFVSTEFPLLDVVGSGLGSSKMLLVTAVVGNTLQRTLLIFMEAPNQGMAEMA